MSWRTSPYASDPTPAAAAGRSGGGPAGATFSPATGRQRDHGREAPGVRGPASRKPRGKEGRGGPERFPSVAAQELGRRGRLGRPRAPLPARGDPRRVRTKSERSRAPRPRRLPRRVRGEVAARLQARGGRRFVTSPVSQQARAARAPPTPGRPPSSPPPRSALRPSLRPGLGLPRRRGASRRPPPAGQHVRGSRAPRPAPAPLGAAPPRRRRDAVLPEGNGLRALSSGDLVVRRLHHLLRGRGALGARQPLSPLHQVRPG